MQVAGGNRQLPPMWVTAPGALETRPPGGAALQGRRLHTPRPLRLPLPPRPVPSRPAPCRPCRPVPSRPPGGSEPRSRPEAGERGRRAR